jgi:hypothetical protein
MAEFGIEAIRYFSNARAAGVSTAGDLSYTFNRANGFDEALRDAGHSREFYWADTDCFEDDIRDSDQGGNDADWVDNVDIFWIETHGNHTADGQARMLFDVKQKNWRTFSGTWELGENWNAEWILAYSCKTVDLANVTGLWNIFAGMHIYCGAWDNMYDGTTTDECGEDVADNLTDGDSISESWIDGVSDWHVDNHPITVCVGNAATWNDGNIKWNLSYLNRDHLWGHGNVDPDLPPDEQACLLWRWAEG